MPSANVLFNGCSITVGLGFEPHQRELYCYDRLTCQRLGFKGNNIAQAGSSNFQIFLRSAQALIGGNHDIVVTQWSAPGRLWLFPGPDSAFFTNHAVEQDFHYRDLHVPLQQLRQFQDLCRILNHDYHNLMDLVDFCNILTALARDRQRRVVFVNGIVPWQEDLVNELTGNLAQDLSDYTKQLLDFNNRDDQEIYLLLKPLRDKVQTLDLDAWVNPWQSWVSICQDQGPQGHHPGILSHAAFCQQLVDYFIMHDIGT